jgi:dephospho-CoA kinase
LKVVGLTGGIATGKSTVGRILSESLNVPLIDADLVARQVVKPGTPVLTALMQLFGPAILQPDGHLDRRAMRNRISQDKEARQKLNQVMHPAIRAAIATELSVLAKAGAEVAVVEAALLVETGSYHQYDALVVATCSEQEQLRRLVDRDGVTESDARGIIATQLPLRDKEAVATVVVNTDIPLEDLEGAVRQKWRETTEKLGLG